MSCIDELENKGYWVNTEEKAITIENQRYGDAKYECTNGKCLFVIKYNYKGFKRIRIKYNISVSASGTSVTCAAGFGIKRLVIWVYDPMVKLIETMNTLVQLVVILQLLTGLLSAI